MFAAPTGNITANPCSFMEEGSSSYLTSTHVNPNSSPSFLNLQPPPSFLDDDQDEEALINHFLSQHQHLNHSNAVSMPPSTINVAAATKAVQHPVVSEALLPKKSMPPRRRIRNSGKKDRHSKICTARGPRDRRMRLSLQIARKFFDLQDMLGFDKASKTIEWLFSKSRPAIKGLMKGDNNSTSSIPPKDQPKQTAATAAAVRGGSSSSSEFPKDPQGKAVAADQREKTTMIRGEHCTPGVVLTNPNDDVTTETFAARFEELWGGGSGDSGGEEPGCGFTEKFYGNVFGEFSSLGEDYWEIINYRY